MLVLSIDVGIKNLAMCIFDNGHLRKWEILNIAVPKAEEIVKGPSCSGIALCRKKVAFRKGTQYYCKVHSKAFQSHSINPKHTTEPYLKRQKVDFLHAKMKEAGISCCTKKADNIYLLVNHYSAHAMTAIPPQKVVKCNDISLIEIGRNLCYQFDTLLQSFPFVDHIIIENQISPLASRMKSIQGMICQYFIMRMPNANIEFVSSANKLKVIPEGIVTGTLEEESDELTITSTTYQDRKKKSILFCDFYLEKYYSEFQSFFSNHKKKDDLADCLLQGIWFITIRLKNGLT